MRLPLTHYLAKANIRDRILRERLTEPLHLNAAALAVAAFGSTRRKIEWDLLPLQHYAFGIAKASELALRYGCSGVSILEFGVATGRGLLNMCDIAARLQSETKLEYRIFGFDTGQGMPPPRDYRDHPDLYAEGDFVMDVELLRKRLPENAKLVIGDIGDTVRTFADSTLEYPIGFVAVDVDYYWSATEALRIFNGANPSNYLPTTVVYFDDINVEEHNSWAGELLAINEFNEQHPLRKIERNQFLSTTRLFKNAWWLDQIYFMHTMDHPHRSNILKPEVPRQIANPLL